MEWLISKCKWEFLDQWKTTAYSDLRAVIELASSVDRVLVLCMMENRLRVGIQMAVNVSNLCPKGENCDRRELGKE